MPTCRLCRADAEQPWMVQELVTWWRCPGCGLFYVDPQPDDALLDELYKSQYYHRPETDSADKIERAWGRRLHAIERVCPRGSVLDVGCGKGPFLGVAHRAGWAVTGMEVDADAVATIPAPLRDQVHIGFLEDLPPDEGPYDLLTLFDVIEHVRDPIAFLQTARSRLTPGGWVAITTPNVGLLKNRLRGTRCKYFDFGRYLHLYHFTDRTLAATLQAAGFDRTEWLARRTTPLFVAARAGGS